MLDTNADILVHGKTNRMDTLLSMGMKDEKIIDYSFSFHKDGGIRRIITRTGKRQ